MEKFTIILVVYLLPTLLYATDVYFSEPLPTFENPDCDNESITIDFSDSNIQKIGRNFIKSPHTICLKIVNSQVSEIEENAFALLPNLKTLDLQSIFPPARFFAFGNRLNVTSLSLVGQKNYCYYTKRIVVNYVYPKLTSLNLQGNCIEELYSEYYPDNAFSSLMRLDLSNNNLRTFNDVPLIPSNLSILYLNNNNLKSFIMSRLQNLEILSLDNNQFENLIYSKDAFDYTENAISLKSLYGLRDLSLAHNNIKTIEPGVFTDCYLLEVLDLSHNKIYNIPTTIFDKLHKLKHLYLNNNKLREIPEILNTFNNIMRLDLDYNMINSINTSSFSHLPNLKALSLANNNITLVVSTSFTNVTELEYLNLSGNRLQSLPDTWCASLISLKYLHLSNNHFTTLEQLSLIPDLHLVDLYLHNNTLTTWRANSFDSLPVNVTVHTESIANPERSSCEDLNLRQYY